MSQNDFTLANQTFPSMRSDMNSALQALASNSAGTSAPSTTFAYMFWYDSTNDILKMRNAGNDAWINIGTFDQGADTWTLTAAGATLTDLTTTGTITAVDADFTGDVTMTGTLDVSGVTLGSGVPGRLVNIQRFTSSGTYTKTSGVTKAFVKIVGGGGGSGSANSTTSEAGAGGGGQSGQYCEAYIDVTSISTATITIGSAGTGSNSSSDGTAGGTSSYSDSSRTITCLGGDGGDTLDGVAGTGAPSGSTQSYTDNSGVTGFIKDIPPRVGFRGLAVGGSLGYGGDGGDSPCGTGGIGSRQNSGPNNAAGNDATGYGAGGGGACAVGNTTRAAGGDGSPGYCEIWEFAG